MCSQTINKSRKIDVVKSTKYKKELVSLTEDYIYIPDFKTLDQIKATTSSKELGITFEIVRRENSTNNAEAAEVLDNIKIR